MCIEGSFVEVEEGWWIASSSASAMLERLSVGLLYSVLVVVMVDVERLTFLSLSYLIFDLIVYLILSHLRGPYPSPRGFLPVRCHVKCQIQRPSTIHIRHSPWA